MGYTPQTYFSDAKNSVRVASTGNISVAAPGSTIDGVTMATGDRVLLKNQSTASQNGIWVWNGAAVAMTRPADADSSAELSTGASVFVEAGTTNSGREYFLTTTGTIVVGTTSQTWAQESVASSGGTPVGAAMDFEGFTLPTGWLWEDGSAVSRATYSSLLSVLTLAQSGTRSSGSPTITGLSSTAYLAVGAKVEGTGIPAGASILTVDSATQVTLSANASSSGTATLTFFPHGNGDGSTTFNVPDARGRASVGMDNIGGSAAGVLDSTFSGLGKSGGAQTHALTAAQTPLVAHTHSGTTSSESANHTHSGTTGTESADHSHSGSTGTVSSDHTHIVTYATISNTSTAGTGARITALVGGGNNYTTSGISANHTHSFTTGGRSAAHTHSITTGTQSANHTHTITTGNPSVAEANGSAHNNMQPSRTVNRIVYAGV